MKTGPTPTSSPTSRTNKNDDDDDEMDELRFDASFGGSVASKNPKSRASPSSSSSSSSSVERVLIVATSRTPTGDAGGRTEAVVQLSLPSSSSSSGGGGVGVGGWSVVGSVRSGGAGARVVRPWGDGDDDRYLVYGGPTPENSQASSERGSSCTGSGGGDRWRCRLAEPMEGGLLVSSPGGRVWGGGRSGRCYAWRRSDGTLTRTWSAHQRRAVTCLAASDCGGLLLTGGADGLVHAWDVADLVRDDDGNDVNQGLVDEEPEPHHTWSEHALPVTALHVLPSDRALSASTDRNLILMELCGGTTIARILVPSGITAVTADAHGRRFFAGAEDGAVYCVDAHAHAIASTAESATVLATNTAQKNAPLSAPPSTSGTLLRETIIEGVVSTSLSELRGHERRVTALVVVGSAHDDDDDDDDAPALVSGGVDGTVRVWDLASRCCVRVVRPWGGAHPHVDGNVCPVSVLTIATRRRRRRSSGTTRPSAPLRRFPASRHDHDHVGDAVITDWDDDVVVDSDDERAPREDRRAKRRRLLASLRRRRRRRISKEEPRPRTSEKAASDDVEMINDDDDDVEEEKEKERVRLREEGERRRVENAALQQEIATLRKELGEANSTIDRWQKVNTALVAKLEKLKTKKNKTKNT